MRRRWGQTYKMNRCITSHDIMKFSGEGFKGQVREAVRSIRRPNFEEIGADHRVSYIGDY